MAGNGFFHKYLHHSDEVDVGNKAAIAFRDIEKTSAFLWSQPSPRCVYVLQTGY